MLYLGHLSGISTVKFTTRRGLYRSLQAEMMFSSTRGPSKPTKSWERSAKLVKDTDYHHSDYMEAIRATHDPSLHLKTIEDELMQTMGQALGKQGDKILHALRRMDDAYQEYTKALEEDHCRKSAKKAVEAYNEHRSSAVKARWELIVHRQAIGMIVNNHKFVTEKYPIPDEICLESLKVEDETRSTTTEVVRRKPENMDTGQLDWWQRVGRWR